MVLGKLPVPGRPINLQISANHLMMLSICTKFQENISKGFRVIEKMQFVYLFPRGIIL